MVEQMHTTGALNEVIGALRRKRALLTAGDDLHEEIRPALVISGGILMGAFGGGVVTALYEQGFAEVFDHVIGVSTGAPTAAYFLGGNPRLGASIYAEECCTKNFIDYLRWENVVDIGYLDRVFRGVTGKVVSESVHSSRTKLWISLTDMHTGDPLHVHPESHEELHTALAGACRMPGVCSDEYLVRGRSVCDGALSDAMPLHFLHNLNPAPTHVLVVANYPSYGQSRMHRFLEGILYNVLLREKVSLQIRKLVRSRFAHFHRVIGEAQRATAPKTAVLWGGNFVSALEQNSEKLAQHTARAEKWWAQHLTDATASF